MENNTTPIEQRAKMKQTSDKYKLKIKINW